MHICGSLSLSLSLFPPMGLVKWNNNNTFTAYSTAVVPMSLANTYFDTILVKNQRGKNRMTGTLTVVAYCFSTYING